MSDETRIGPTRPIPSSGAFPLVIGAHGTRDAEGLAATLSLVDRVRGRLPGVRVEVGFVEIVEPLIDEALATVLAQEEGRAAVVPLMLGGGGHVRRDIPGFIAEASATWPGADVRYTRPVGDNPRLLRVLADRLAAAAGDWELRDVAVVLLGRGSKVPEANAETARVARMLLEASGAASVVPAYLQVTRRSLPEARGQVAAYGARRVVVVPQLLLPGLLRTWTGEQVGAWGASHTEVEVRVAEIIGDCDELADAIIDRYREAVSEDVESDADLEPGSPVYLSGLRLQGRDVLVVGAGHVSDRRVPRLLQAGARVRLVSPSISVKLRRMLAREEALTWEQRPFTEADVAGAWYIMAATNDPAVNARVAAAAEAAHTFCVRADDATQGSAWTPAVETRAGMTVAAIGNRNATRATTVRDALLEILSG